MNAEVDMKGLANAQLYNNISLTFLHLHCLCDLVFSSDLLSFGSLIIFLWTFMWILWHAKAQVPDSVLNSCLFIICNLSVSPWGGGKTFVVYWSIYSYYNVMSP